MHSYASEDPVFVAMNQRGQRETGGQLGTFCIACHAPLAGTSDLAQVPRENRGVGCVACHQVSAIEEVHNGKLQWDIGGPNAARQQDRGERDSDRKTHRRVYCTANSIGACSFPRTECADRERSPKHVRGSSL